ncbi:MAG: hypothetical protein EOO88_02930 [Pedobacter sp.]|nr:MAG: hypothetical protein EOO88_02930 [Pedobacter sp.]
MIALLKIITLLSFLLFTQASIADEPIKQASENKPKTLEELKVAIEKIRRDTNTPAVGIALINKDGPYWVAGLGEADVQKNTKADENTMFRIGSVSKMFVALSVLKLVEEGKLHLTDEVHYLAPEIKFENQWEKTNPVLLVHLLEHTTGWDEMHPIEISLNPSDKTSLREALNFHTDSRKSRWVPGTRYAYNNIGPAVSAYIIEKVTGKKYEDYVQENFLNPLQMDSTSFYKTTEYDKRMATLYTNGIAEKYAYQNYRPSGAVNASAKDMANLLQFFINRGSFAGHALLTNESIIRMETPTSNLGAAKGIRSGYGLHNFTTGHAELGYAFHGHDGALPGVRVALMYSHELQSGYVIMTSTSNGSLWQMTELMAEYLLKDMPKKPIIPAKISEKFKSMSGIYVPLSSRNEILRFKTDLENAIKISATDDTVIRSPALGGWESHDYAIHDNLLATPWTGLPSIAVVTDPLVGEALQVDESIYKRVSAPVFYGKVGAILFLAVFVIFNLLFAIVWIPRWFLGKITPQGSIQIRLWPMLSSLMLISIFILIALSEADIAKLGYLTWVSLSLYLCSLIYPMAAIASLFTVYKYRNAHINKLAYINATIFSILHTFFAAYLTFYGIVGYKGWAE